MDVYIRFEYGSEDRVSEAFGPFAFIQQTLEAVRVATDIDTEAAREIAHCLNGIWITEDDQAWSDVVIYTA